MSEPRTYTEEEHAFFKNDVKARTFASLSEEDKQARQDYFEANPGESWVHMDGQCDKCRKRFSFTGYRKNWRGCPYCLAEAMEANS